MTKYLAVAFLGACTFGGSSTSDPQLVSTAPEPAGANCAAGGVAIHTGFDTNGNGTLDASEITSTSYVCAGANGTDGMDGSNGSNGTNGTNGTNGSNGSNGSNGLDELVTVVGESPGANCTTGGQAIEIGYDTNNDGVLEPAEITTTTYVCNPANKLVVDGDLTISAPGEAYLLVGVKHIRGKLTIDAPTLTSIDVSSIQAIDTGIEVDHFGGTAMTFTALTTTPSYSSQYSYFSLAMPAIQQINSIYTYGPAFSADSLATATSITALNLQSDVSLPALTTVGTLDIEAVSGQLHAFSAPQATEIDSITVAALNADLPALTTTSNIWLLRGAASFSAPAITTQFWLELDDTTLASVPVDTANVYQYYLGNNANLTVSSPQTSVDTIEVYGDTAIDFPNATSVTYFSVDDTLAATQISMPALTTVQDLDIEFNSALTTLSFPALTSVYNAYIADNASLPTCAATAITSMATNSGIAMGNNDQGTCN